MKGMDNILPDKCNSSLLRHVEYQIIIDLALI